MADGGDDRNLRIINGPGHPLVVEGPQILDGTAAPPGDDDVRHSEAVGVAQRSRDFRRRLRALHPDGQQLHLRQRIPAAEIPDHIVNRRPCGGGDDRHGSGIRRQGLFVVLRKQPLLPQLLLELLKGHMEIAHPLGTERLAIELVGPVPGENADPARSDHLHAVFRTEPEALRLPLEHHAADGPLRVLQGKIVMPGRVELIVGNLPPDKNMIQLRHAVQHRLHQSVQLRYAEDLPLHGFPPSICRSPAYVPGTAAKNLLPPAGGKLLRRSFDSLKRAHSCAPSFISPPSRPGRRTPGFR